MFAAFCNRKYCDNAVLRIDIVNSIIFRADNLNSRAYIAKVMFHFPKLKERLINPANRTVYVHIQYEK